MSLLPVNKLPLTSGNLSMGGFKITNHPLPTATTDVVNKAYADSIVSAIRISATAILDFAAILVGGQQDLTIAVVGALVNDSVSLGLPTSPATGIVFQAFVSVADVVTVRAHNAGTVVTDPASATYRVTVFK